MSGYLVDENVLKEIRDGGHFNVVAWHDSVEESDLHISVITIFEKRRGWERKRRQNAELVGAKLAELDSLAAGFGSRLLPIDGPVAAEWARLVGVKDKNRNDRALVATVRVHDLVLVTRNVADMEAATYASSIPSGKSRRSRSFEMERQASSVTHGHPQPS